MSNKNETPVGLSPEQKADPKITELVDKALASCDELLGSDDDLLDVAIVLQWDRKKKQEKPELPTLLLRTTDLEDEKHPRNPEDVMIGLSSLLHAVGTDVLAREYHSLMRMLRTVEKPEVEQPPKSGNDTPAAE